MTPARRKRFLGPSEHTVDKKGRMSFAKRFQDALDRDDENRPYGVMCLEPSHGRCIWVFNDEGFDQEMEGFGTGAFAAEVSAPQGWRREQPAWMAPRPGARQRGAQARLLELAAPARSRARPRASAGVDDRRLCLRRLRRH